MAGMGGGDRLVCTWHCHPPASTHQWRKEGFGQMAGINSDLKPVGLGPSTRPGDKQP